MSGRGVSYSDGTLDKLESISGLNTKLTLVSLDGGRARKGDPIDPAVGVQFSPSGKVGSRVEAREPLLWVHARTSQALAAAKRRLLRAYGFAHEPVPAPPLIHGVIRAQSPSLTSSQLT